MTWMTSKRALRWTGRVLALLNVCFWLACGVDGERAMSGECPTGEVCSSETPDGLNFSGASPSDLLFATTLPTAVGGTQTWTVRDRSGGYLPAFTAVSDDPSVLEIVAFDGSTIEVLGLSEGSTLLRVVNDAGELLDRTSLVSAEVDRVELRGVGGYSIFWHGPWAFLRGSSGRVVFALSSEGGERLVDQSARPVIADGVEPAGWDAVDAVFDGPGSELRLAIELGAGRREAAAPLVDVPERIARAGLEGDVALADEPRVQVGGSLPICFVAMFGESAVAGARFEIAAEGPVAVELDPELALDFVCAGVQGLAAGEGALIVRTNGLQLRQPIIVEE